MKRLLLAITSIRPLFLGGANMPRVLLRVAALVAILVLGFIAIAQAQRGSKDQAQEENPPLSTVATPAAPAGSGTAPVATAPRMLPTSSHINPLRNTKAAFPADAVQTAAAAPMTNSAAAAPAKPAVAEEKAKPADPFAPRLSGAAPASPAPPPFAAAATGREAIASDPAPTPLNAGRTSLPPPAPEILPKQPGGLAPPRPVDPLPLPAAAGPGATPPAACPTVTSALPPSNPLAAQPLSGTPAAGPRTAEPAPIANPAREPVPLRPDVAAASTPARAPAALIDRPANPLVSPPAAAPTTPPDTSRGGEGTGRPGGQHLEGPQAPQLMLQKIAPPEVQVGKPCTFQIKLKNTGQVTAQNVEIRDEIPRGTRLLSTIPRASRGVRGELVWALGSVKPNDEVSVEIQLMPTDEGEIGSVASVAFNADASAHTMATKPQLAIKTTAPNRVLIGEEVTLAITISNPGSGVAQKIVLEEKIPPGLQHPAGPELEYDVGTLKPGESRQIELKLVAAQAGLVNNLIAARGDANLRAEDRVSVEVLAPQLDLVLEGPKRRYLEREATYTVSLTNPGTASARQVQLVAQLPPGLKFLSANNAGHYEETSRTVRWTLEELPSKETGSVALTTIPVEPGEQTLRLKGTAERGVTVEKEHPVVIEGIAALLFEVVDTKDPIEVGGESTYEIRVVNQGSKAATNVLITAILATDMRPVAAEGPTRQTTDAGRVVFEPLPRLAPKADAMYRIRVQGTKPGDQRIRVQLTSDEVRAPITKEESTRVYSDE